MSERNILLLLQDIESSIIKILDYTKDFTLERYEADMKTKDAVERNFEIIGEASAKISEKFRQSHNNIEWRIIKDFRNFIIHEYFGVNNLIVWDTIQYRLPELLQDISILIEKEKDL